MFPLQKCAIISFLVLWCATAQGQDGTPLWVHSHNDYEQGVPFWKAFSSGLNTVEADIHLEKGALYVAHDRSDLDLKRTLEALYLDPMVTVLENGFTSQKLNLMIDIKSDAVATLTALLKTLRKYPKITNSPNYKIIISGNRPDPSTYHTYPKFIHFDHQQLQISMDPADWERVAMISLPFGAHSQWNGKGRLTHADFDKVKEAIDKAHQMDRPFRFWGTPDSKTAWRTFVEMGVDVINTDRPFECASYIKTLSKQQVRNDLVSEVYYPSFKNDGVQGPVKNVILMIGDGNGLAQISSAVLANNGELTLTQLKSVGLIKTQSADDFTTDSAAAGTALATGSKTNNRAVGTDVSEMPLTNIMERLRQHDYMTACITTDQITGATPAAFYAHRTDRSDVSGIAIDLGNSKLDLFMGGGSSHFKIADLETNFKIYHSLQEAVTTSSERVGIFLAPTDVPSILEGRGKLLPDATKWGLQFLEQKGSPFFLMVEAAQIDSFGHTNNTAGIVSETVDFDRAIREAIEFADRDGETLVIVTADHETSGFALPSGNIAEHMVEGAFFSNDHTAIMVPVFAYGPQSDRFSGVYENTGVFHKIMECLGKE